MKRLSRASVSKSISLQQVLSSKGVAPLSNAEGSEGAKPSIKLTALLGIEVCEYTLRTRVHANNTLTALLGIEALFLLNILENHSIEGRLGHSVTHASAALYHLPFVVFHAVIAHVRRPRPPRALSSVLIFSFLKFQSFFIVPRVCM